MSLRRSKAKHMFYIKKDTVTWLALVLLTLPHLNPEYLNQFSMLETLINALRLITFVVIVFWVLIFKKKISQIGILIGIWEVFIFTTTLLHQGEAYNSATAVFSVLSIVLLYDAAYNKGEAFLSAQLFCFELVIYINLFTIFVFPNGMYVSPPPETYTKNWFLGYYNMFTRYFVPALMFAWLYKLQTGKKIRSYLLTASIFVTVFRVWSGGEITLLCVMVLVYLFFKNRTTLFNYYTYWLLHVVFFVCIFVFRLQDLLLWFVGDILGKWSSLVGRISVWDKTYELFLKHPLTGHGIQNGLTVRRVEYGLTWGAHAHNLIWELLYQGGIVGIALWCIIIIVAGMRLYKYRNTAESKIISVAFLGWCVATLVEPYMTAFLMGMFVIAYHSNHTRRKNAVLSGETQ